MRLRIYKILRRNEYKKQLLINTRFDQHKYWEEWKNTYKWLKFDGKENKMFCEFCREFPDRKNMQYSLKRQTDNLKAHKASEGHTVRHLFGQQCTSK